MLGVSGADGSGSLTGGVVEAACSGGLVGFVAGSGGSDGVVVEDGVIGGSLFVCAGVLELVAGVVLGDCKPGSGGLDDPDPPPEPEAVLDGVCVGVELVVVCSKG